MAKEENKSEVEAKSFVITNEARVLPRTIFSPINNQVRIAVGGEVSIPATETSPGQVIREATDKEYAMLAKMKGMAHLVYDKATFE
jgi:hypothetical protein